MHVITNLSMSDRGGEFIITCVASHACSSLGRTAVGRFVIDHMTAGSVFSDQSALTVKGNAHYQATLHIVRVSAPTCVCAPHVSIYFGGI